MLTAIPRACAGAVFFWRGPARLCLVPADVPARLCNIVGVFFLSGCCSRSSGELSETLARERINLMVAEFRMRRLMDRGS